MPKSAAVQNQFFGSLLDPLGLQARAPRAQEPRKCRTDIFVGHTPWVADRIEERVDDRNRGLNGRDASKETDSPYRCGYSVGQVTCVSDVVNGYRGERLGDIGIPGAPLTDKALPFEQAISTLIEVLIAAVKQARDKCKLDCCPGGIEIRIYCDQDATNYIQANGDGKIRDRSSTSSLCGATGKRTMFLPCPNCESMSGEPIPSDQQPKPWGTAEPLQKVRAPDPFFSRPEFRDVFNS